MPLRIYFIVLLASIVFLVLCAIFGSPLAPVSAQCKPYVYVEYDVEKDELQPKLQQWEDLKADWRVVPDYSKFTLIAKVPCKGLAR
jgi:hypothetical protein